MAYVPVVTALALLFAVLTVSCADTTASKGTSLYEVADRADRGNAQDQHWMGMYYLEDTGMSRDVAKARGWFELAAAQGHAESLYELGLIYLRGRGVRRDPARAVTLFRRAADEGHVGAQYRTGIAYLRGIGVAKEPAWASRWLHLAADAGHPDAQFSLGLAYRNGTGVPKNPVEAWKWLRLAEMGGVERAALRREGVAERLSAEDAAHAAALVASWQPRKSEARFANSATVTFVQQALATLGYEPGTVDGVANEDLAVAIESYRREADLAPGSAIDAAVVETLRVDLASAASDRPLKADLGSQRRAADPVGREASILQ